MAECGIGEKLRALREEAGVSQEEVAAALGVSNKTVSKWERGTSEPDLRMMVKLSAFYHISTDSLLGVAAANNSVKESIGDAFAALNRGEAALKTFEIIQALFPASFDCMRREPKNGAVCVPGFEEKQFCNMIVAPELFSFLASSDDVNVAVMHFRNRSDFAWLKDEAQRKQIAAVFRMLGDPDMLRILAFLHTETCSPYFTAGFMANHTGLPVEKVTELLEILCDEYAICKKKTAYLKEGEVVLYMSMGDSLFLAMCAMVKARSSRLSNDYSCRVSAGMIGGNEK